jgi:ABC-type antimicrobial peptide transport system permease subunit
MTFRTLIRRNLRFHWRAHLGVVLGAAIGSAALIGALVVGDSVRESLRERVLARLGYIGYALEAGDRTFTDTLVKKIPRDVIDTWPDKGGFYAGPAAALLLNGIAIRQDESARANRVQIMGVIQDAKPLEEDRTRLHEPDQYQFWNYAKWFDAPAIEQGEVWLNQHLTEQLTAQVGDEIILRLRKPTALAGDAPLSPRSENSVALRLRVGRIVSSEFLGDFDLRSEQRAVLNAFVHIADLQKAAGLPGRANLIVGGGAIGDSESDPQPKTKAILWGWGSRLSRIGFPSLGHAIHQQLGGLRKGLRLAPELAVMDYRNALADEAALADYEVTLRVTSGENAVELISRRIFLEPRLVSAATQAATNTLLIHRDSDVAMDDGLLALGDGQGLLTYLVNLLRAGTNATPYSMVTAAGAPWTAADLRDDEIVVSQWLADDLRVKPGDEIATSYFLPESGAKLEEATNAFRVHSIVPPQMPWADRTLMPDFPGLEKAESTSEWDAGFPLTYKVRPKDDEYWKQHRGTPKAFITLAAGQKMWGNRFGNLTAIRFPIPTNEVGSTTALPMNRESVGAPASAPALDGRRSKAGGDAGAPVRGEGGGNTNQHSTFNIQHSTTNAELARAVAYKEALEKKILANLKPEELGLRFEPVREQALKAAAESQDFGGLFLGFSFFLILAALLLMALLFQLGLEQRAPEIGTLLALGFTPQQVRKLLLREGVALALLGGIIGTIGGLLYARAMLHGLNTIWRDAVGDSALNFHFTGQTLLIGLFASVVVSAVTIWLSLRKFVKRPERELLVGDLECGDSSPLSAGDMSPSSPGGRTNWWSRACDAIRRAALRGTALPTSRQSGKSGDKSPHSKVAWAAFAGAIGLVGFAVAKGDTSNAGVFFGAGALVLVAGLSLLNRSLAGLSGAPNSSSAWLESHSRRADQEIGAPITLAALALRGCARRRKRSLSTVAMLACGSFLIVSISVFRLDANRDATKRTSGTGGFALIGETTMPVVQDLNSRSGREFFALNEADLPGVNVVPFRVRDGDEASCLNLNGAQRPKLLGVKPAMLEGRFAFAKGGGWPLLQSAIGNRQSTMSQSLFMSTATNEVEIPAIGDANSIQWAMHKKVGDTIDYVDERGQPFKVRIVGAVANSILQGQLIIDETDFVKRFPGESGYRMFLLDAPSNAVSQVSATLSRAMQDVGLELTPAAQRLAQFNAVQNTYLGTFQVLGGLGLLLGSVGLGIVVLRNVLERRGELALLLAVGFRKAQVQGLLLLENGALLVTGLALGMTAAAVAVLPALLAPGAQLPVASLALTLGVVLLNGAVWTWAATRLALRGDLLAALRNE